MPAAVSAYGEKGMKTSMFLRRSYAAIPHLFLFLDVFLTS
jgi:hypothetical protein